ncbi:MAG: XTP/dITP diphosphatase [Selenomonadales bacterium]|nr:XTP/dITP diphosphatase [Selenomonadales bacterium]
MKRIVLATKNKGKIKEMRELLAPMNIEVLSLADFSPVDDAEENGATFAENAMLKARYYFAHTGTLCLADDSGLEVDALGGRPGVYSARYSGEDATDAANNAKVLREMEGIEKDKRTARFRCAMALVGEGIELTTDGTCEGALLTEERGQGGFGYDPIFYVPKFDRTLAEMSSEEKNSISHRGAAVRKMADLIAEMMAK